MSPLERYTCEDVFRRLDDYLDRELDEREMRLVREHLETCAVCASQDVFEGSMIRGLREKLKRIDAPKGLLAKIDAQLARERDEPGGGA